MTKREGLAVVVIDVSVVWEDAVRAIDRGCEYRVGDDGRYEQRDQIDYISKELKYPYGRARNGIDAIADVLREASILGIPTHSVSYYDEFAGGEDQLAYSLQAHVPAENRYWKYLPSAFACERCDLRQRLIADNVRELVLVGFDRDGCLLDTARDAEAAGFRLVTSERLMLTLDRNRQRDVSMAWYREHTNCLETIPEVLNHMVKVSR